MKTPWISKGLERRLEEVKPDELISLVICANDAPSLEKLKETIAQLGYTQKDRPLIFGATLITDIRKKDIYKIAQLDYVKGVTHTVDCE